MDGWGAGVLAGLRGDAGWLAAVAVAWAGATWVLSGWWPADRARAWAAVVAEAHLVWLALVGIGERVAAPFARLAAGGGRSVSLGEVAEMIDILRLGLSAGLSFDAALGLYCEGRAGELAHRMAEARLCWQMGVDTREHALMRVAAQTELRPLESFAVAVGQALALGAPLAETLARQGTEIRAAHRAEVERQIERAPVKMLIPTGTLILPALLLSILGPLMAAGGML